MTSRLSTRSWAFLGTKAPFQPVREAQRMPIRPPATCLRLCAASVRLPSILRGGKLRREFPMSFSWIRCSIFMGAESKTGYRTARAWCLAGNDAGRDAMVSHPDSCCRGRPRDRVRSDGLLHDGMRGSACGQESHAAMASTRSCERPSIDELRRRP